MARLCANFQRADGTYYTVGGRRPAHRHNVYPSGYLQARYTIRDYSILPSTHKILLKIICSAGHLFRIRRDAFNPRMAQQVILRSKEIFT